MKRTSAIVAIVVGGILALGPLWGFAATAFGMMRAFEVLGKEGIADPRQLSAEISATLFSSLLGLIACPIGLLLAGMGALALARAKQSPPPPLGASNDG